MQDKSETRLLTRSEIQDLFGISKRYLELAISRGDGPPYIRFGRSVRYRASDIITWIEANRVVPSSRAEN